MIHNSSDTIAQHYIPRMYLKCFSEVIDTKKNKAYIWQYSIESFKQINTSVNIEDICFEKDLYEMKDIENSYIARNYIEKTFSRIEANASNVIKSIENKIESLSYTNYNNEILSEEDISNLIIFMTSLNYRDPQTIEKGIDIIKNLHPDISYRDARNYTLMNLLPLSGDNTWDKNTIIRTAIEKYCGMTFQIGVSTSDNIITCDCPVIEWPKDVNDCFNRPKAVVFPLTSRIVLYLYPLDDVNTMGHNCAFLLSDKQINDLYYYVAANTRTWIYSRNRLSIEQEKIVKSVRG